MDAEKENCQNCKIQFTIEPDDFQFYEKIQVPPPTFCPECRLQRRLAWRNERSIYKDICDLCKKSFVSMYSPDKKFTVYCKECWYSDKWDPFQYGRDYDWNKPFFAQCADLMRVVPRIGIMHIHTNVNSDYANYVADSKNVYLAQSVTAKSENVYYSWAIDAGKDIFDCFQVKESERCYEDVDCARLYRSHYLYRSRECLDSAFLFDCVNCQNCFMSANLRGKRYVFRNEQCSKNNYEAALEKVGIGKYSELELLKQEFGEMMRRALHKYGHLVKTENCTGDNIENSKNLKSSFMVYNCENSKFIVRMLGAKDSFDVTAAGRSELAYELLAAGYDSYNSKFTSHSEMANDSRYCDWCQSSENLFGCVGLRKKQHCILNKQYSKKEYEELVPRIIAYMNEMPYIAQRANSKEPIAYRYGEFFPTEISPFAYNETMAQEYFPLTKESATAKGYRWHDPEPYPYQPTLAAKDLPDDIRDTTNSILKEIIGCPGCGRAYRIMPAELEFLKRDGIALPRQCIDCRHRARFSMRNPLKLWHRRCMCSGTQIHADMTQINADETNPHRSASYLCASAKYVNTCSHFHGDKPCPNEFETSYAPERSEIVYCEQCYQSEVA